MTDLNGRLKSRGDEITWYAAKIDFQSNEISRSKDSNLSDNGSSPISKEIRWLATGPCFHIDLVISVDAAYKASIAQCFKSNTVMRSRQNGSSSDENHTQGHSFAFQH